MSQEGISLDSQEWGSKLSSNTLTRSFSFNFQRVDEATGLPSGF